MTDAGIGIPHSRIVVHYVLYYVPHTVHLTTA